jgi:cell division protein FtsL
MIKYFYWIFGAAFLLSFYVWEQTQPVRLGYKVDNLRIEYEKWDQQNKALRLKINNLMSLERLDEAAKQKGLITPNEKTTVYLNDK